MTAKQTGKQLFEVATEMEKEEQQRASMSLEERIQRVKVELQSKGLKKTGKNTYDNYDYFTLNDFLPSVNELFLKYRLYSKFWIDSTTSADGIVTELAHLLVRDFDNPLMSIEVTAPTAEANGRNPIQILGSKHTYMRRYMYMDLLDIAETDMVDAGMDHDAKLEEVKPKTRMASSQQIQLIQTAFLDYSEDIGKAMELYKAEKYSDLTMDQASKILLAIERKKTNVQG